MSSSDSDDTNEADNLDDDIHENGFDGTVDVNETSHLTSLYNSLISSDTTPIIDGSPSIRSAFKASSRLSSNQTIISSIFGDSIHSYIEATSLFQSNETLSPYYLSLNSTNDQSQLNSVEAAKLFVGNIAYAANAKELKEFFIGLGFNVVHLDLLVNPGNTGHRGIAFVRFGSADIAQNVQYQFGKTPNRFKFRSRQLKIGNCRKSQPQSKISVADQKSNVLSFNIGQVLYGTLIKGTTMNNITGVNSAIEFGLIANSLVNNEENMRIRLQIDEQERKFSIIVSYGEALSRHLTFEWAFSALKGEKISPILINDSSVSLLIELKRPPVIIHSYSNNQNDEKIDLRMPGTPLIGHANAWVFQLNSQKFTDDYSRLFHILRLHNLSSRRFIERNIWYLIYPIRTAREYLRHVQILSNNEWIKDNREIVNRFLNNRWPQYPFETKFELMKLLSKHIITIHDLIIDENLDKILAQCSLNTFIACVNKIIEFAHHSLYSICDDNEEDEEEQSSSTTTTENLPMEEDPPSHIISLATGTLINVINTEPISLTTTLIRSVQKNELGYLSRFLLIALDQLRNKYELRRNIDDRIYVTKHELHPVNVNSFLIRKVYITPCTIFYEGPYYEERCPVTRRFEQQQDGFLRVSFRDEDYRKLQYTNAEMSQLYDRMKAILINGVNVCDRRYNFLAFSSSQLREHCCWMFSSMNNVSVETIRNWMGDFRNIHPVAKMAARLGQSFSTSKKGLELTNQEYRKISDVYVNGVCFTDGIGIIAPWLIKKLYEKLGIGENSYHPCAFQIRFGGYKGMVCLDVANRISEPDVGLYLRDSMNKFDSSNYSIDIIRGSSMPSAGFLNRQIILLLSCLGIDDEVFLSMQDKMLHDLQILKTNPKEASDFLRNMGGSGGNGYHAFLLEYLKRFNQSSDPFVQQILVTLQGFLVKELRTKARIFVPNTWCLFGVIDETRDLQYGEVFIQIEQKNESGNLVTKTLTGPIIVTRNPCFHPGDIRRLIAKDIPALRQLKNVIVFPINDKQSHPAEMSGGDLDGDTFWISQDERLLFTMDEKPFDYHDQAAEDAKQIEIDKTAVYGINDVCYFFVEYIEADNLGVIAVSHMAFADLSPLRARASECLTLARMHSTAVDFAKNGVKAPRITKNLRPPKYPHYMENRYKENYHSNTILGQLYDDVKQFEEHLHSTQEKNVLNQFSFPYDILMINGLDVYTKSASATKNAYDLELKQIMRQYGIQNEAELVSGYILKFTSKQYVKQSKLFDLRNEISYAVKVIQDKYLHIFYEELYQHAFDKGQLNEDFQWSDVFKKLNWKNQFNLFEYYNKDQITNENEIMKKASAWFYVTYKWFIDQIESSKKSKKRHRKRQKPNENNQQPSFFSFAWIVYPVIMEIYDNNKQ
ncbi:hypothetical protein I4U23_011416 [Adineta vaga]|nr:hypothetical protein I4U23_011416 [Adineta vaga]